MNKKPCLIVSSIALLGLTSCTQSNNTEENESLNTSYISTRTISPEENIVSLDKDKYKTLGSYDYTNGVSLYPVIQNVPLSSYEDNAELSEMFTIEEVQSITDALSKEYNDYLNKNIEELSKEYENYINSLNSDYTILEEEYLNLLNDILNSMDNENGENNQEIITEENDQYINGNEEYDNDTNNDENSLSREEELNLIYEQALTEAGKNTTEFEPVQGIG